MKAWNNYEVSLSAKSDTALGHPSKKEIFDAYYVLGNSIKTEPLIRTSSTTAFGGGGKVDTSSFLSCAFWAPFCDFALFPIVLTFIVYQLRFQLST